MIKWKNWSTETITEETPLAGAATVRWRCINTKRDIKETVEVTLDYEKTYPEEDFKFDGKINGKEVRGTYTTGLGSTKYVEAVEEDEDLSDAETVAGVTHIDWLL